MYRPTMRTRLKRAAAPTLVDRAVTIEALVSLLRAGLSVPCSLEEWPDSVPDNVAPHLRNVARSVALGAPVAAALGSATAFFGDDIDVVRAAVELNEVAGVDPIPLLVRAATLTRARAEADATGKAAAAGARLSGGMVGGLPLVALPLLPMAHAPILDPPGSALLVLGLILTAAGMVWIHRLVPRAHPDDEPVAAFLDHVVAALRAGAPLGIAFDVTFRLAPRSLQAELAVVRGRTDLGQPLADALEAEDGPAFGAVAAVLRRAERLGTPPASALEVLAETRRTAARHAFEREVRRAPILMVVPLVLCVLPAFGLLAIVPFLRGIAFG